MKTHLQKFLSALFLALIVCACTEEQEDRRPDPDYSLNVSQDGVRPMQLVTIEINGISNLEDHYKGTFGNTEIDLIKEVDNRLLFVVPATAVGEKQTLKVSLNNREKQVEFTVLQKIDVPDGNAYLQAILAEAKETMGTGSEETRINEISEALGGWIGAYEEALSSLGQEEKYQLALLVKTNLLVEEQHASSRLMNYDCFDRYAPIYMKNLALMLVGGKMVGSGQLLNVAMPGLGLAVGIAGGVTFLQGAKRVLETVRDIHDCPILRGLESFNFNQRLLEDTRLEFESNLRQDLVLHVNYRSLDREDTSHPVAFVKSIAESIIDFESILHGLKQQLNSVRAFFGVNSTAIPTSGDPVLQKNGIVQVMPLQTGSVTVENISNEKVVLGESMLAEGKLSMAFQSESLSAQEFDFDLVIKDGPIEHREKIEARILPEEVVLEGIGLDDLYAEPGSELSIKVKVKTKSGIPINGADVRFIATIGSGTFNSDIVKSDEDGLVTTTLKVSNDHRNEFEFQVAVLDEEEEVVQEKIISITQQHPIIGKWDSFRITIGTGYNNGQIIRFLDGKLAENEVFSRTNVRWIFNSDLTWEYIYGWGSVYEHSIGTFSFEGRGILLSVSSNNRGDFDGIEIVDIKNISETNVTIVYKYTSYDYEYFQEELIKVD